MKRCSSASSRKKQMSAQRIEGLSMRKLFVGAIISCFLSFLLAGTSVGSMDIDGTVNISDTQTNTNGLYIGAASAGTLIIQSGGDFTFSDNV
jgi:hypothetical protein